MTHQPSYCHSVALLKDDLCDLKVGKINWTPEDQLFLKRLEQLPFDFQVIQCLSENRFSLVSGLEKSFGHKEDLFDIDAFYWNIHPEDVEEVVKKDRELLKWISCSQIGTLKQALMSAQFRFSDSQGRYHKVNRNSFIIKLDSQGKAACIYHMFVDVSETEKTGKVSYRIQYPGKRTKKVSRQNSNRLELTKRENQVLKLIVEGYSSQEIGNKLFISRETVYRHRKNMIKKTKVRDTKDLALKAIAENWV